MANNVPLFQYKALPSMDHIRLLIIHPGRDHDPIICSLKEVPLKEAEGKYEGISYAWGSDNDFTDIDCDGHKIRIQKNLHDALLTFRYASEPRTVVWADAVCINQKDDVEKGHTVRRMAEIFQKASRVLCWLGTDSQGIAESCFGFVRDASQQLTDRWESHWTFENLINDLKLPNLTGGPTNLDNWSKFRTLLSFSWFERLWVVQEAGLARICTLFWGEHTVQLYEIIAVAAWTAYSLHAPRGPDSVKVGLTLTDVFLDFQCTYDNTPTWRNNSPIEIALSKLYPKEKQLYVDLLHSARRLKITDQRDVIYCSLGSPLALGQDGKLMVVPDYTEPIDELHIRAARALLLNPREAPQTLLRVVHQSKDNLGDTFPSWVPRWKTFSDKDAQPLPLTYTYDHRLNPYTAGGITLKFAAELNPENVISVTGIKVDAVYWTSLPLKVNNLRSDVSLWEPHFKDNKVSSVEVIWESLLETSQRPREDLAAEFSLVASRGRPDTSDHVANFLAYCEHLRQLVGSEGPSPFPSPDSSRASPSNGELAITRCRDRRIAYTTQGRLALVPLLTEPGDICFICQGMATPVVLRPTSKNMYRLVGDMYLNGLMDGEALQTPGQNPPWETLQIR